MRWEKAIMMIFLVAARTRREKTLKARRTGKEGQARKEEKQRLAKRDEEVQGTKDERMQERQVLNERAGQTCEGRSTKMKEEALQVLGF